MAVSYSVLITASPTARALKIIFITSIARVRSWDSPISALVNPLGAEWRFDRFIDEKTPLTLREFFVFFSAGTEDIFGKLHHSADAARLFHEAVKPFELHLDEELRRTLDDARKNIE